jgi:hypothetical protein
MQNAFVFALSCNCNHNCVIILAGCFIHLFSLKPEFAFNSYIIGYYQIVVVLFRIYNISRSDHAILYIKSKDYFICFMQQSGFDKLTFFLLNFICNGLQSFSQ